MIRQSVHQRVELKEAHSAFSRLTLWPGASVRPNWFGGMLLAAAIFLPSSDRVDALAADKDLSNPAINVSVHEGLLTLRAIEMSLADVMRSIGEAAGFRVVFEGAMDTPVSWTLTDVPLEKALRRLLDRRAYVMTFDEPQAEGEMGHLAEVLLMRNNLTETGPDTEIDWMLTATTTFEAQNEILITTPDDDRDTRLRFVRTMAQRPKAGAVNGLSALLSQDEDPMIRRIAAIGLGKAKGDAALEALVAAIQDDDASVRRRAIQGLGKKRDDRAVQALGAVLLQDPDPRTRRAAVHSLRMMSTEEAFETLLAGEFDPDYYVRRDTVLALDQMREHGIGPEN